jgi:hypothetical protein
MVQHGSGLIVHQQIALVIDPVDVQYIAAQGHGCYRAKEEMRHIVGDCLAGSDGSSCTKMVSFELIIKSQAKI